MKKITKEKNKEINQWIKDNVPDKPPTTPGDEGRCITYAGALAKKFKGKLIKGTHKRPKKEDSDHFWTIVDGKTYDPTKKWYPNGRNIQGKEVSIVKNKKYFNKDKIFKRLIKESKNK